MKLNKWFILGGLILLASALLIAQPAAALRTNPNALNAQFLFYQERQEIIHFLMGDDGNEGVGPAYVKADKQIVLGGELIGCNSTIEEKEAIMTKFDYLLSIDGGEPFSIMEYFQPVFIPEVGSGPRWTWDHDGDGIGDGDGDGIGDWPECPIAMIRYPHPGFDSGTHTFHLQVYYEGNPVWYAFITVEIVPDYE